MICRDGSVGAAGQTTPTKSYEPPLKMVSVVVSHPFLADLKTWHHWSTIGLFLLGNLYRHCSADALQAANTCVMLCLSSLNTVAFLAFHSMLDTTTFCSDLIDVTKQSAYVSIVIAETVLWVIGCVVLSPVYQGFHLSVTWPQCSQTCSAVYQSFHLSARLITF